MAYKSRKYELCSLKVECTNVAKEFTGAELLDVNKFFPSRKIYDNGGYLFSGTQQDKSGKYTYMYVSRTLEWSQTFQDTGMVTDIPTCLKSRITEYLKSRSQKI